MPVIGSPCYSEPFPRGGPAALITVDVIALDAGGFVATLRHRDDDAEPWAEAGSIDMTGAGVATKYVSGLKRTLQFRYATPADGPGFATFRCPVRTIAWLESR